MNTMPTERSHTAVMLCRDCPELFDAEHRECPRCGSVRLIPHAELGILNIAHVDCDAFYASVEKRDNPGLRDKPLIVGHAGSRGVVLTACYIARKFGPRSAMPMFQAIELCPDAVVIQPDMPKYKRVSRQIRTIFRSATPAVEPVSLDEAYLDLSKPHRSPIHAAAHVLAEISLRIEREVGITVSIGLSINKFLAKLASDLNKPSGFSIIGRAEAKSFLARLPVRKINGVGEVTAKRLEQIGITTIGQLQSVPEMQLFSQFGKLGRRLAQYAHGRDERKVTPHRPAKSVSAETTFRIDVNSVAQLADAAKPLCERVAARLHTANIAGATVSLKLKTSDFQVLTRNCRLGRPTQRPEILYHNLLRLLEKEANGRSFRLIGVGMSALRPADEADPPGLFDGLPTTRIQT